MLKELNILEICRTVAYSPIVYYKSCDFTACIDLTPHTIFQNLTNNVNYKIVNFKYFDIRICEICYFLFSHPGISIHQSWTTNCSFNNKDGIHHTNHKLEKTENSICAQFMLHKLSESVNICKIFVRIIYFVYILNFEYRQYRNIYISKSFDLKL